MLSLTFVHYSKKHLAFLVLNGGGENSALSSSLNLFLFLVCFKLVVKWTFVGLQLNPFLCKVFNLTFKKKIFRVILRFKTVFEMAL